jgi:hypothetical protein
MHTHWEDTPFDELPSHSGPTRGNEGQVEDKAAPKPAHKFEEDASIPFLKLRGRWLRQMGFNVGSRLKIEAGEGVITISLVGHPVMPERAVPRTVHTRIHQARVKADSPPPWPRGLKP